jgi:hypothetical protein
VPRYDPSAVAATADRFSLRRWQEAMAQIWEELIGPYTPLHPKSPDGDTENG